jgi:hypothetical protein
LKNIITIVWERGHGSDLTFHAEYSKVTLDWFLAYTGKGEYTCHCLIPTPPLMAHSCIDRMVNAKLLFDELNETKN